MAAAVTLVVVAARGPTPGGLTTATTSPARAPAIQRRLGVGAPLALRTVVLDPGHGGADDGGKVGGVAESDLVLEIAREAARLLEEAGVRVVLTRQGDYDLAGLPPGARLRDRKRADLAARARLGNELGADAFVSVHGNVSEPRWRGAQTFYSPRGHPDSSRLAASLQEALREIAGPTDRLPNAGVSVYLMEHVRIPFAIAEVGFLSNPQDLRLLADPAHRQRLARAIAVGIGRYLLEGGLPAR